MVHFSMSPALVLVGIMMCLMLVHCQARSVLKKYRQQAESLEKLRAQLRDAEHLSGLARERALEWSELFWINREEQ